MAATGIGPAAAAVAVPALRRPFKLPTLKPASSVSHTLPDNTVAESHAGAQASQGAAPSKDAHLNVAIALKGNVPWLRKLPLKQFTAATPALQSSQDTQAGIPSPQPKAQAIASSVSLRKSATLSAAARLQRSPAAVPAGPVTSDNHAGWRVQRLPAVPPGSLTPTPPGAPLPTATQMLSEYRSADKVPALSLRNLLSMAMHFWLQRICPSSW